jgi:predicted nuclease with TOPRIM domain
MNENLDSKKELRPVVLDLTPGEIESFIYEKKTIFPVNDFPTEEYLKCSRELKEIREKIAKLEKERADLTAKIPQLNLKIVEIEDELKQKSGFQK